MKIQRERERERESKTPDIAVPLSTAWFDEEPERYLAREDFIRFQDISGVDFMDLLSDDRDKVMTAQTHLAQKSVLLNEIRKLHFGYGFPLLVYTHDMALGEAVVNHNQDIDETILARDMGDSLRRRHITLSHAAIPQAIDTLYERQGRPVVIKNLGSGVGLDCLNALIARPEKVDAVINYDTSGEALQLGEKISRHLEAEGKIRRGVVRYVRKSLTKSREPADLIVKIGVICGLRDFAASYLLAEACNTLNPGGMLIVSTSNENMEKTDPLGSFLIQHIGTRNDPFMGWGLNFRKKETLEKMLREAGYSEIAIYSDTEYPGRDALPEKILHGIDTLPAEAMGYEHSGKPLSLPPREVLDQRISYNWIAVAAKG